MNLITTNEKDLLLDKLCPLGSMPKYSDNELTLTSTSARRFILDVSSILRFPKSRKLINKHHYNSEYLGFGIYDTLSIILQDNYELYEKMFLYIQKIDLCASQYIKSCEQAVVLFSHKSFGEKLFTHIHQQSTFNRPTLSIFSNLTSSDSSFLTLYNELNEADKRYQRGYTDHRFMKLIERESDGNKIQIDGNGPRGIFFNAATTPHEYSYSDDLWITLVYDQVDLLSVSNFKNCHVFSIAI